MMCCYYAYYHCHAQIHIHSSDDAPMYAPTRVGAILTATCMRVWSECCSIIDIEYIGIYSSVLLYYIIIIGYVI